MADPTLPSTSLRRSWAIQRRVIGALLMREVLTRYGRHNIGFLWLFFEPMIFTLGVTALWTALRSVHNSNIPIVAFAITGYSSVLLWRNMPARTIGSVTPNLALMYHRNVKVIDVYLSRLVLEMLGATMSFSVLASLFTAFGWMDLPEDPLRVLMGWFSLAFFGVAVGIFMGALSERTEIVEKIWHPATYLLFPLSGAAFTVETLPPAAQDVILLLPMVHGVEFLREGYFGSAFNPRYDMAYMWSTSAVIALLGLANMRYVSRRVVPE